VDLSSSSDEEGLIPDTSHDEEFTWRLFGDMNRDVLRLLGDIKVIILSDSNEEEEVREEDVTDAEATRHEGRLVRRLEELRELYARNV
jgi:hypothetical protein